MLYPGDLLSMNYSRGKVHEVRYEPSIALPACPVQWLRREACSDLVKEGGRCSARVAEILEPLKCRLITKGNGLPYIASMPYQVDMWEKLREHPQFALIGEPLEEHHLHDLLDREKCAGLTDFDLWVSGDYSAATDGLSQQVNSLCMHEYMKSISASQEERMILSAVLGNHLISYPEKENIPEFEQKNGQLMGSPLSFPVLCSINVAAYWCALEEYTGRSFPLDDLPVLVNGDDILFRANPAFYEVWNGWVRDVGFTLSLGKNYLARDVFTINSECFMHSTQPLLCSHEVRQTETLEVGQSETSCTEAVGKGCGGDGSRRPSLRSDISSGRCKFDSSPAEAPPGDLTVISDPGRPLVPLSKGKRSKSQCTRTGPGQPAGSDGSARRVNKFHPIGYIHSGLLHSSREEKEFSGGVGTRPENLEMPCIAKIQRILDTANDPVFAFKRCLRLWATEISEQTNHGEFNLFIPCEFGGLGLKAHPGIEVRTTPFQRQLAGFLYQRIKNRTFGVRCADDPTMHDLSKSLATEGKTTFVRRTHNKLSCAPALARGEVIFRSRMEPLREDEERVPDLARCLKNYQTWFDPEEGWWSRTRLPAALLSEFRENKGKFSTMLQPFSCDLEPRVRNLQRSDSDTVWLVRGPEGSETPVLPNGNSSVCRPLRFPDLPAEGFRPSFLQGEECVRPQCDVAEAAELLFQELCSSSTRW